MIFAGVGLGISSGRASLERLPRGFQGTLPSLLSRGTTSWTRPICIRRWWRSRNISMALWVGVDCRVEGGLIEV